MLTGPLQVWGPQNQPTTPSQQSKHEIVVLGVWQDRLVEAFLKSGTWITEATPRQGASLVAGQL